MRARRSKIVALGAGALMAFCSLGVAQPAQAATNYGPELRPGQQMNAVTNDYMRSVNGSKRMVMQADGNLVLYSGSRVCASSNTYHLGVRAIMQYDGNFVVYASNGSAVWRTATGGGQWPGSKNELYNDGHAQIKTPNGAVKVYWRC